VGKKFMNVPPHPPLSPLGERIKVRGWSFVNKPTIEIVGY